MAHEIPRDPVEELVKEAFPLLHDRQTRLQTAADLDEWARDALKDDNPKAAEMFALAIAALMDWRPRAGRRNGA